jgi:3-carboxy-cis,cis-muconate cycloisomerase
MRRNLDRTRGLIVSERLSAVLAPRLGRARAKELLTDVARRASAEDRPLCELLAEQPELEELDLAALTDPAQYTGFAGALTDRALERR